MKNIKIKNQDIHKLRVLQHAISEFLHCENESILSDSIDNQYLDSLLKIDIATRIYFHVRDLIEKNKPTANVSLSISEAVILLQVCQPRTGDDFENHALRSYTDAIHKSLTDLNLNTAVKQMPSAAERETYQKELDRVIFHPKDVDEIFEGTVIETTPHSYLVIPDDNLTGTARWNKKFCTVITKTRCQRTVNFGKN